MWSGSRAPGKRTVFKGKSGSCMTTKVAGGRGPVVGVGPGASAPAPHYRLTDHLPPATCHLPPATCHLPPATCHLPPATCHLPLATCHLPPATSPPPPATCHLPPA